ncbi:MAG: sigma-70 family RNA polymerase sigma factor [Actinomycetota bacterium]
MDEQELRIQATALTSGAPAEQRDAALAAVAGAAAEGVDGALPVLLRAVLDHRLAENAVRTVLLDPADIDDAIQATLIAVSERIRSFEGRSRFTTWLHTVARNEALMVLRRRSRRNEPSGDPAPEFDPSARRLSSLIAGEQAVEATLAALSEEHRLILDLRERQGFSYEEIGKRLDLAPGTVRSRLSRARRHLADVLVDQQFGGR